MKIDLKPGDVVKCIKENKPYPGKLDEEYTIERIGDTDIYLKGKECHCGVAPNRFVLVRGVEQRIEQLASGVRQTPEVRCACCHVKAPRIVVKDHATPGNLLNTSKQVNQPNLNGWMLIVNPYKDVLIDMANCREGSMPAHGRFGQAWEEVLKICSKCSGQVMGTVKHMVEGYNDAD